MANYGVQKSSLSAVLSWYNNQDDAAFRIFRGNKENDAYFCDGYTGSDREEGEMALAKALSEIEPTDYNTLMMDPNVLLVTGDDGDHVIGNTGTPNLLNHDEEIPSLSTRAINKVKRGIKGIFK